MNKWQPYSLEPVLNAYNIHSRTVFLDGEAKFYQVHLSEHVLILLQSDVKEPGCVTVAGQLAK